MLTGGGARADRLRHQHVRGRRRADARRRKCTAPRRTPPPERLTQRRVAPAADVRPRGRAVPGAHGPAADRRHQRAGRSTGCRRRSAGPAAALWPTTRPPDSAAAELADLLQAHTPRRRPGQRGPGGAAAPTMTRVLPTMAQTHHPSRRRIPAGWLTAGGGARARPGRRAGDRARAGRRPRIPGPRRRPGRLYGSATSSPRTTGTASWPTSWPPTPGSRWPTGGVDHAAAADPSGLRPNGAWSLDGSALASPAQTPLAPGRSARSP
jgi:hypothetical protein